MRDNPCLALYDTGYTALLANDAEAARGGGTVRIAGRYGESGDILVKNPAFPAV
jgi:diaminopimelate decarboxylase